jgi:hypothetical protein
MTDCYHCEARITSLPYKCKYCGLQFCKKHRLPENHSCPFDLKQKSVKGGESLLYQDAFEFIRKELTVAEIYDYVTTNQMTKLAAVDLLNYFYESATDPELRKISVLAYKVLELVNKKAYSYLESYLL